MAPCLKYCRNRSCVIVTPAEKLFRGVFYEGDWLVAKSSSNLCTRRSQMVSERQPLPSNDLYEAKTREFVDEALYSLAGRVLIYIESLTGGTHELL